MSYSYIEIGLVDSSPRVYFRWAAEIWPWYLQLRTWNMVSCVHLSAFVVVVVVVVSCLHASWRLFTWRNWAPDGMKENAAFGSRASPINKNAGPLFHAFYWRFPGEGKQKTADKGESLWNVSARAARKIIKYGVRWTRLIRIAFQTSFHSPL